ncbi:MAG: hypothetical protein M1348_02360 [Candidatus Parvarchaeota archaeon]|jgi:hypothetical protein|nr:hypothetical protein [Candidatus Parvarchaeota archaeon]
MGSEIDEIFLKVSNLLSRGPALTIDIAEYIGKDTTQTSAILDYYVGKGDIGRTERRYGTSAIYYLGKDLDLAINKLYETLNGNEKTLVNKIKNAKVLGREDLTPAERYILKALMDFVKIVSAKDSETGETIEYIYYYSLSLKEVSDILNTPKHKMIKSGVISHIAEVKHSKAKRGPIQTLPTTEVKNMLFGYGFSGVDKVDPGVYICEYGPNRLKSIVIMAMKANLTKKDFIKFAGYAASYKTVSFIITNAKKIADYSEYGNIINIIKTN